MLLCRSPLARQKQTKLIYLSNCTFLVGTKIPYTLPIFLYTLFIITTIHTTMVKAIKTIYLDSLLVSEAEARGIKLSQTVEELLREFFNLKEKPKGLNEKEKLLVELADAKRRLALIEAEENSLKQEFNDWMDKQPEFVRNTWDYESWLRDVKKQ